MSPSIKINMLATETSELKWKIEWHLSGWNNKNGR
jgi:hypothetical protein